MLSYRSRAFLFILRNRHFFHFKLKPESGLEWETSLPEVRRSAAKASKLLGKVPKGIRVSSEKIGDIAAEWIRLEPAFDEQAILYFHGGGYVLGSIRNHRGIVSKFVKGSRVSALLFEYRLAPEHPFPAALDDSIEAYQWLLNQGYSASKVVFVGDSAGGGLCLATLLALRDQGLPLPAAAVAFSPWTDLKCTGESYLTNAEICLSPKNSWTACSKHYVGDNDPALPWISPLYGDLHGLPPLCLYAGENEALRDDSIRFAQKAKDAGVEVTLRIGEKMCHCYPACSPLFPEARQAMDEICGFISGKLNNP